MTTHVKHPKSHSTATDSNAISSVPSTHIYVLLDRSGSMEAIRSDVVGGFNAFVAGQQADGDDARLTLVQFDSGDIADVVFDDVSIELVKPLTEQTFVPRGATPLLDATGKLIAKARKRAKALKAAGKPEAIVFVTITDGQENASSQFTVDKIRKLIENRKAKGWTFVFLSAGPDVYAEAGALGYEQDAIQAWGHNAEGTAALFSSVTDATSRRRGQVRSGESVANLSFFDGNKPAEALLADEK